MPARKKRAKRALQPGEYSGKIKQVRQVGKSTFVINFALEAKPKVKRETTPAIRAFADAFVRHERQPNLRRFAWCMWNAGRYWQAAQNRKGGTNASS